MKKRVLPFLGRTFERLLFLAMIAVCMDYSCFVIKRAASEVSETVGKNLMPLVHVARSQPAKESDDDRARRTVKDFLKDVGLAVPPMRDFR